jgi:hypothetical protein
MEKPVLLEFCDPTADPLHDCGPHTPSFNTPGLKGSVRATEHSAIRKHLKDRLRLLTAFVFC